MKKILKKVKDQKGGFTLIELLVVIAIIGILTAIILPNFATAQAKSRDAKRVSDISQLKLALELFSENCGGVYPVTLTSSCSGNSAITVSSYLSSSLMPTDPSTDKPYIYVPLTNVSGSSSCTGYHLGAATEQGAGSLTGDANSSGGFVCTASGTTPITYGDGSTGSTDFYGTSAQCTLTNLTSTQPKYNYCYDVTN